MSDTILTEREQEYLRCETPMISGGSAAVRIITGVFGSLAQAAFTPGNGKADMSLMRTMKEIRYTRYKKAVLRKQDGAMKKSDRKLLIKLNKKDFILAEDTYDPDEFTRKVYEEYMRSHSDN